MGAAGGNLPDGASEAELIAWQLANGAAQAGGAENNWFQLGRSKPAVAQPRRLYVNSMLADETTPFERADKFTGPRPGKTYKSGPQGLGYYQERGEWVVADARYHHVDYTPGQKAGGGRELPNFRGGLVKPSDVGLNAGYNYSDKGLGLEGSRFMTFGPMPEDYSVYKKVEGLQDKPPPSPQEDKNALPPMRFGNPLKRDEAKEKAERFRDMMKAPSLGGVQPTLSPKTSARGSGVRLAPPADRPQWDSSLDDQQQGRRSARKSSGAGQSPSASRSASPRASTSARRDDSDARSA
jgi:hypothetical protein